MIKILQALANEKRMEIIGVLCMSHTFSVGDIAKEINLSESATSQHLRKLRLAGLVQCRSDKTTRFYRMNLRDNPWVLNLVKIYDASRET